MGDFASIDAKWTSPAVDSTWGSRPCPGCLGTASRLVFRKKNVPYVECTKCGTVRVEPAPPESLLKAMYEDLGDYFTDDTKLALDFDPKRHWRELGAIPADAKGGRLLDVGCATGSFLASALEAGFTDVRGIDLSSRSTAYANKRIGRPVAMAGDFLTHPFRAEEFDVVTCWASLEHVREPEGFVREAQRVLKRGGILCASVPNRGGISMRLLGPRYSLVDFDHLNYFTPSSLGRVCERNGLSVLKAQARGFNPLGFLADYRKADPSDSVGMGDMLQDQARKASLRDRPFIRYAELLVDRAVTLLGVGDTIYITAVKE